MFTGPNTGEERVRLDLPHAAWGLEANELNHSAHLLEQVLAANWAVQVLLEEAGLPAPLQGEAASPRLSEVFIVPIAGL